MENTDKNNTECKCPNKIVDCLPDALELKNQRLPGLIRFGVWFPLIVVVLAIAWSIWAKTDVVIQGSGKLVTDLPTIVMKPLERSVIKQIHVRIGDIVKKDQILITFDPEYNTAEAERLQNEIVALSAELARLQAEFYNKPFNMEEGHFSKWQKDIYTQRHQFYQEKMNYYTEALLQIEATKKNKADSYRKQSERLEQLKTLEGMYKDLYDKKVTSLKEYIEMTISRMGMEATVEELGNEIVELEHRRGTTVAEKNSFIQEWKNKISEDMVEVDRNLTSVKKQLEKQDQLLEYLYLKAPCNAVVHEIASFSPGSAVREAEALITLIPLDGRIELEAEVRPQDIGKLKPGAAARIKLTAYPFQKYGTLDGTVRNISEDTLEKNEGNHSMKYYRVRIMVGGKLRNVPPTFRLIPGMESQCEIKCGERRVIEYVLYPLIKALDETAREP